MTRYKESLLFLQTNRVQFPAPTLINLEPPGTTASEVDPIYSSGLCRHPNACELMIMQTYPPKIKQIEKYLFL